MNITEATEGLEGYCKPWEAGGAGNNSLTAEIRVVLDDHAKLRTENARLRSELAKLDHPLILAEGGTSDADRAIRVINKLSSPQWYWDDRELESAAKSIGNATQCDDPGDIIELRPLHELPTIYVLVGKGGHQVFGSMQAAENAAQKAVAALPPPAV